MSRKDDRPPESQKKAALFADPSGFVTSATSGAKAPFGPARSMASTGTMHRKMPAKSLATSWIGPQEKPFASRSAGAVRASDAKAAAMKRMSRTTFCSSMTAPPTAKLMPGFHAALIRIAAMTTPIRAKLTRPTTRSRESGVGSGSGLKNSVSR